MLKERGGAKGGGQGFVIGQVFIEQPLHVTFSVTPNVNLIGMRPLKTLQVGDVTDLQPHVTVSAAGAVTVEDIFAPFAGFPSPCFYVHFWNQSIASGKDYAVPCHCQDHYLCSPQFVTSISFTLYYSHVTVHCLYSHLMPFSFNFQKIPFTLRGKPSSCATFSMRHIVLPVDAFNLSWPCSNIKMLLTTFGKWSSIFFSTKGFLDLICLTSQAVLWRFKKLLKCSFNIANLWGVGLSFLHSDPSGWYSPDSEM